MQKSLRAGASKHLSGVFSEYGSTNVGDKYVRSHREDYPLARGKQFEVVKGVGSRVNPDKSIGGDTSYNAVGDEYENRRKAAKGVRNGGPQFTTAPAGGGYAGTVEGTLSNTSFNAVGAPYQSTVAAARKVARGKGKGFEIPGHGPSQDHCDKTIGGATTYHSIGDPYEKFPRERCASASASAFGTKSSWLSAAFAVGQLRAGPREADAGPRLQVASPPHRRRPGRCLRAAVHAALPGREVCGQALHGLHKDHGVQPAGRAVSQGQTGGAGVWRDGSWLGAVRGGSRPADAHTLP